MIEQASGSFATDPAPVLPGRPCDQTPSLTVPVTDSMIVSPVQAGDLRQRIAAFDRLDLRCLNHLKPEPRTSWTTPVSTSIVSLTGRPQTSRGRHRRRILPAIAMGRPRRPVGGQAAPVDDEGSAQPERMGRAASMNNASGFFLTKDKGARLALSRSIVYSDEVALAPVRHS
jgi:hypothetical protein